MGLLRERDGAEDGVTVERNLARHRRREGDRQSVCRLLSHLGAILIQRSPVDIFHPFAFNFTVWLDSCFCIIMPQGGRRICLPPRHSSVNNPQLNAVSPPLLPLLQSIHILTSSLGCGYKASPGEDEVQVERHAT